jgi:hypothetical protein
MPEKPVDSRFSRLHSDPRFIRPKKKDGKLQIDSRFASALDSKEFEKEENMARFYQLDDKSPEDAAAASASANDRARGRGGLVESSDEEEVEMEEGVEEGLEEGKKEELVYGDDSSRLALVSLDWDHVSATDIFALFNSFCPADGKIQVCLVLI